MTRTIPSGLALASAVAVLAVPAPGSGQSWDWCSDRDRHAVVCEVREFSFAADGDLVIDGGLNGGIGVTGWDGDEVRVEARVRAQARSDERAEELADEVRIRADADRVSADGPRAGSREGWSVSYRVMVPRGTDLDLETHNGGISIADVEGHIRFSALNGGVKVSGVGGDVAGRTTNGGVSVELTGDAWRGAGLDVETTNGGVVVAIPEGYSAEFETGTVNGGFTFDVPMTVQGKVGRRFRSTLGDGGAPVRVTTTNGGVRIVRAVGS